MDGDPRTEVEAPVRRALAGVMVRGLALVAGMALLALWPLAVTLEEPVHDALAAVAVGLLVTYAGWVRLAEHLRGRLDPADRALAWDRAKQVDSEDATMGLLVAGWVPVGIALALALLLWPNLTAENPAKGATWTVMALPPTAIAWLLATIAWLDACRDDLARGEAESLVRLRTYWANVGH